MQNNIFEQIKKINEYGKEYWRARDLYKLLGYTEYGKFLPAIERAKSACKNSGQEIGLHFAGVSEPQKSRNQYGEISGQTIDDYLLSRYACYLIAQNGDPRKEEIAMAKLILRYKRGGRKRAIWKSKTTSGCFCAEK